MSVELNFEVEKGEKQPEKGSIVRLKRMLEKDALAGNKKEDLAQIQKWVSTCSNNLKENLRKVSVNYDGDEAPKDYHVTEGLVRDITPEQSKQAKNNFNQLTERFKNDFVKPSKDEQKTINKIASQIAQDDTYLQSIQETAAGKMLTFINKKGVIFRINIDKISIKYTTKKPSDGAGTLGLAGQTLTHKKSTEKGQKGLKAVFEEIAASSAAK